MKNVRVDLVLREDGSTPSVEGRIVPYGEWSEVDSATEGHFVEQFAPGSFAKTLAERVDRMRVFFEHGRSRLFDSQPVAVLRDAWEAADGLYFRAELLDGLPELFLDGLRRKLYGASIGAKVVAMTRNRKPRPSARNPDGLEERTYTEMQAFDFTITPRPHYASALTMRSLAEDATLLRAALQPGETPEPMIYRGLGADGGTASLNDYYALLELRGKLDRALEPWTAAVEPLLPAEPKPEPEPAPVSEFWPDAAPRHTIHFANGGSQLESQFAVITDFARTAARADVETGGFLWAAEPPRGGRAEIVKVSGPARDSRHEKHSLVLGLPREVDGGVLRADFVPCGDWHTHTSLATGMPSPADRESWALRAGNGFWVSLIVHRRHDFDTWSNPYLTAWVTYKEKAIGRFVTRPASIERER